ncbi:MAG: hypothetical protein A3F17_01970 [Gammaproteobacteria bacterium RIFCSPHIGHO2_12_FULL_41_15]|nr:MAG: hypothetical protein A3F17_01970 [Gammaproteobacteria bacterium RIFCSPHIGHO2_12_FULL_41_15]
MKEKKQATNKGVVAADQTHAAQKAIPTLSELLTNVLEEKPNTLTELAISLFKAQMPYHGIQFLPHQVKAIEIAISLFIQNPKTGTAIFLPTGAGKTFITLMSMALQQQLRYVANTEALFTQLPAKIQLESLAQRIHCLPQTHLIICHESSMPQWEHAFTTVVNFCSLNNTWVTLRPKSNSQSTVETVTELTPDVVLVTLAVLSPPFSPNPNLPKLFDSKDCDDKALKALKSNKVQQLTWVFVEICLQLMIQIKQNPTMTGARAFIWNYQEIMTCLKAVLDHKEGHSLGALLNFQTLIEHFLSVFHSSSLNIEMLENLYFFLKNGHAQSTWQEFPALSVVVDDYQNAVGNKSQTIEALKRRMLALEETFSVFLATTTNQTLYCYSPFVTQFLGPSPETQEQHIITAENCGEPPERLSKRAMVHYSPSAKERLAREKDIIIERIVLALCRGNHQFPNAPIDHTKISEMIAPHFTKDSALIVPLITSEQMGTMQYDHLSLQRDGIEAISSVLDKELHLIKEKLSTSKTQEDLLSLIRYFVERLHNIYYQLQPKPFKLTVNQEIYARLTPCFCLIMDTFIEQIFSIFFNQCSSKGFEHQLQSEEAVAEMTRCIAGAFYIIGTARDSVFETLYPAQFVANTTTDPKGKGPAVAPAVRQGLVFAVQRTIASTCRLQGKTLERRKQQPPDVEKAQQVPLLIHQVPQMMEGVFPLLMLPEVRRILLLFFYKENSNNHPVIGRNRDIRLLIFSHLLRGGFTTTLNIPFLPKTKSKGRKQLPPVTVVPPSITPYTKRFKQNAAGAAVLMPVGSELPAATFQLQELTSNDGVGATGGVGGLVLLGEVDDTGVSYVVPSIFSGNQMQLLSYLYDHTPSIASLTFDRDYIKEVGLENLREKFRPLDLLRTHYAALRRTEPSTPKHLLIPPELMELYREFKAAQLIRVALKEEHRAQRPKVVSARRELTLPTTKTTTSPDKELYTTAMIKLINEGSEWMRGKGGDTVELMKQCFRNMIEEIANEFEHQRQQQQQLQNSEQQLREQQQYLEMLLPGLAGPLVPLASVVPGWGQLDAVLPDAVLPDAVLPDAFLSDVAQTKKDDQETGPVDQKRKAADGPEEERATYSKEEEGSTWPRKKARVTYFWEEARATYSEEEEGATCSVIFYGRGSVPPENLGPKNLGPFLKRGHPPTPR